MQWVTSKRIFTTFEGDLFAEEGPDNIGGSEDSLCLAEQHLIIKSLNIEFYKRRDSSLVRMNHGCGLWQRSNKKRMGFIFEASVLALSISVSLDYSWASPFLCLQSSFVILGYMRNNVFSKVLACLLDLDWSWNAPSIFFRYTDISKTFRKRNVMSTGSTLRNFITDIFRQF